jgi:dihydrodipicolinate synthase/N-acetylneuraminate lyase
MPIKLQGVMQAPVTPLNDDFSFDADGFAKMVDFHVRHGAPAIAWPHHKAESLNLTIAERKLAPCRKKTLWTSRSMRRRSVLICC